MFYYFCKTKFSTYDQIMNSKKQDTRNNLISCFRACFISRSMLDGEKFSARPGKFSQEYWGYFKKI